jgi:hypothetical protein
MKLTMAMLVVVLHPYGHRRVLLSMKLTMAMLVVVLLCLALTRLAQPKGVVAALAFALMLPVPSVWTLPFPFTESESEAEVETEEAEEADEEIHKKRADLCMANIAPALGSSARSARQC